MVFTQGMEVSVLLHVTDFLGSPWASSLISKAMRPITPQRCITRWDGASACKVWAPALLIYVRAFARIRGRLIGPYQRKGRSDTGLGGLGCCQGWHLHCPLPSWYTLRTPKSSFSMSGVASPLKFSMSKLPQNLQIIWTSTGISCRWCEDQLKIWDLPLPREMLCLGSDVAIAGDFTLVIPSGCEQSGFVICPCLIHLVKLFWIISSQDCNAQMLRPQSLLLSSIAIFKQKDVYSKQCLSKKRLSLTTREFCWWSSMNKENGGWGDKP